MSGTCYETEEPSGQRSIISNMGRMLTKEFRSKAHKIVKTTGSLQCCRCRNHRSNNQHHIDRYLAWMHTEDKHQDEHTHHTVDTQTYSSDSGTDEDKRQYNKKLE